jgi:hypothetical protein
VFIQSPSDNEKLEPGCGQCRRRDRLAPHNRRYLLARRLTEPRPDGVRVGVRDHAECGERTSARRLVFEKAICRPVWRTSYATAHSPLRPGIRFFVPRMKSLLLRTVVLARRRKTLAESTRRAYLRRLDHQLNAIMVLAPTIETVGGCANVTAKCAAICFFPRTSRCTTRQPRQRARIAAHSHIPLGRWPLPIPLGC